MREGGVEILLGPRGEDVGEQTQRDRALFLQGAVHRGEGIDLGVAGVDYGFRGMALAWRV